MKFCKWFGVLFFLGLGCSIAANAQLGLYATATGEWFGGITCPSFASPCAETDGKVKPFGGNFGAYYEYRNLGPMRWGFDVRGAVQSSNKRADSGAGGPGIVRNYEFLGGVRGTFKTPLHWLHPYAEITGGIARNNSSGLYTVTVNQTQPATQTIVSYNPQNYTVYPLIKGFAGVDIPLLPYLSFRAVEFGLGEAFGSAPTVQTPTATTYSPDTHGIQSIGAGVVFTIPFTK